MVLKFYSSIASKSKPKIQKVLRTNFWVWKSYMGKTGKNLEKNHGKSLFAIINSEKFQK